MIKKALEYIVGLSNPTVQEIGGETYSDKELYRINHTPYAKPIEMNTLSALIDYIRAGVENFPEEFSENMIVHVQSPTRVCMYSALDRERKREYLVEVKANIPNFAFDQFQEHEAFCIGVQSKFQDDLETDKALLLKFAGTVEAGSVAEYGDDGVSQKATVKTGIASKGEAIIPSPVKLRPFRTFAEVYQPTCSFIFRMKEDKYKGGIQCALFEADGGAWKISAMESIKFYLTSALEDFPQFLVIS